MFVRRKRPAITSNDPVTLLPFMLPAILALALGLWFVSAPRSVIGFYTRFHRRQVKLPPPSGVRLAGWIWLVIVLILMTLTEIETILISN